LTDPRPKRGEILNDRYERAVTTDPDSPLIDDFYATYCKNFLLPNERETLPGFRQCLAFNDQRRYPELHKKYAPYREYIAVWRDIESGLSVAGANFICFPMPQFGAVTIQSNYVFVDASFRGRGIIRRIYRDMTEPAWEFAESYGLTSRNSALLQFGEQNDPFKMTLEEYQKDSAAADLDQFDRLIVWGKLGTRVIDYPYVQPPLSEEQEADRTLFFRVMFGAGEDPAAPVRPLDPQVLKEHLRRFFSVSVLKGRLSPSEVPEVAEQFDWLDRKIGAGEQIATYPLPPRDAVAVWKASIAAAFADPKTARDSLVGPILDRSSVPEVARMLVLV
jgi:GNAT superfamily N-acetyltransferase